MPLLGYDPFTPFGSLYHEGLDEDKFHNNPFSHKRNNSQGIKWNSIKIDTHQCSMFDIQGIFDWFSHKRNNRQGIKLSIIKINTRQCSMFDI